MSLFNSGFNRIVFFFSFCKYSVVEDIKGKRKQHSNLKIKKWHNYSNYSFLAFFWDQNLNVIIAIEWIFGQNDGFANN